MTTVHNQAPPDELRLDPRELTSRATSTLDSLTHLSDALRDMAELVETLPARVFGSSNEATARSASSTLAAVQGRIMSHFGEAARQMGRLEGLAWVRDEGLPPRCRVRI